MRKRIASAARKAEAGGGRGAHRLLSAWIPVILLESAVLFLSSRPQLPLPPPVPHLDKVAHFVEYALLGVVLYRAFRMSGRGRRGSLGWTLGLIALLGAGDEWLQSAVPGRNATPADWTADLLGGCCGALLARRWEARWLPMALLRRGREEKRVEA